MGVPDIAPYYVQGSTVRVNGNTSIINGGTGSKMNAVDVDHEINETINIWSSHMAEPAQASHNNNCKNKTPNDCYERDDDDGDDNGVGMKVAASHSTLAAQAHKMGDEGDGDGDGTDGTDGTDGNGNGDDPVMRYKLISDDSKAGNSYNPINSVSMVDSSNMLKHNNITNNSRWPREEAMALLRIRSELSMKMQEEDQDLWEQISRRMAEMGYQRSGKKCKEKLENMHKYYMKSRRKQQLEWAHGSATVADENAPNGIKGIKISVTSTKKHYTFSHELEALHNNNTHHGPSFKSTVPQSPNGDGPATRNLTHNITPDKPSSVLIANNVDDQHREEHNKPSFHIHDISLTATTTTHCSLKKNHDSKDDDVNANISVEPHSIHPHRKPTSNPACDHLQQNQHGIQSFPSNSNSPFPTKDSMKIKGPLSKKARKVLTMKKYLLCFHDAMKKLVDKQEEMQRKFLEALERRDKERIMVEEALKRHEMARLNVEHEMRIQDTMISASRDSSLIDFLHKAAYEQGLINFTNAIGSSKIPPINDDIVIKGTSISTQQQQDRSVPLCIDHTSISACNVKYGATNNTMVSQDDGLVKEEAHDLTQSTKRWPKPEVLALIKLRTNLNKRFHESGPKAMLWEEISRAMFSQGFNRAPKRCKEKWENINKYFKKAKESKKTRPENANTCPYFHHLNALYKQGLLGGGNHVSRIHMKAKSPKVTIMLGEDKSTATLDAVKSVHHSEINSTTVSEEDLQSCDETKQEIATMTCIESTRKDDEALTILSSVSSNIIARNNVKSHLEADDVTPSENSQQ